MNTLPPYDSGMMAWMRCMPLGYFQGLNMVATLCVAAAPGAKDVCSAGAERFSYRRVHLAC